MRISKAALLGASWLALAGAAHAQVAASPATPAAPAAPAADRIAALEAHLAELEAQIAELKESTSADVADVRRVQTTGVQTSLANGRPSFATADGAFRAQIRGIFQFDAASYDQENNLPAGSVNDLNSGANFRRARIGIEGTAFTDWNYALTYEAGGSGVEAAGLQQAWLEYAGWKPFGLTAPVRFRIGAFAVENTLEGATSNAEQIFIERPSPAELVRGTFGGDGRNAFGVYANGDRVNLSAILVGSLIGNTDVSATTSLYDEQTGYVLRAAAIPLRGPNSSLHVGVNYSSILQSADGTGTGANTIRLRERPELRVDDSNDAANSGAARLIDTNNLTVDNANAFGVELGGQWRNFYFASEYLTVSLERPGALPDPDFTGWYVQGAWTITGEQHKWNAVNGGYAGVRPANPFDPSQNHWGAWEIAARYSTLDLNWREGLVGVATPANGVRGGEQTISTIGLNWYPNSVVRFLLEVQDVDVDRIGSTAPFAQIGQDYRAIALRSQVSF